MEHGGRRVNGVGRVRPARHPASLEHDLSWPRTLPRLGQCQHSAAYASAAFRCSGGRSCTPAPACAIHKRSTRASSFGSDHCGLHGTCCMSARAAAGCAPSNDPGARPATRNGHRTREELFRGKNWLKLRSPVIDSSAPTRIVVAVTRGMCRFALATHFFSPSVEVNRSSTEEKEVCYCALPTFFFENGHAKT